MFHMIMGISGSGKTTYAKQHAQNDDLILDSDEIREELYGDAAIQTNPSQVFHIMLERSIAALQANQNVWYCATNLAAKHRINLLQQLPNVKKDCTLVGTPPFLCYKNNVLRERVVPREVIEKQLRSFQVPFAAEGWDEIQVVKPFGSISWESIKETMRLFGSQENTHHKLNLYDHCLKTSGLAMEYGCNTNETIAAFFHDCGKPYVFEKGKDGQLHYVGHANYGSYLLCCSDLPFKIAQLVGAHMYPYENTTVWETRCGETTWKQIMKIHQMDEMAH